MAVNPGTCIPAAVQSFINDFYGDCIGNAGGITVFINVDSERNISVGIETCLLSVYPYFRLVVSTFKIEGEDFVRISRLEDQFFSVPSFTAYGLSGIRSAYAAGLYTVMVPDQLSPTEEILALVDKKCDSLTELQAQLTELLAVCGD